MERDAIVFRLGRLGEEGAQKALWKTAFGDSDTYIDSFYNHLYSPERMALAMDGSELAAMCALLPVRICLPCGTRKDAAYLYALATDPARRGQGIARGLLAWADGHLHAAGVTGVCTVPARPSLHRFFASAGYGEGFSLRVAEMDAEALPPAAPGSLVREVDAQGYRALRAPLLRGRLHVEYDVAYFAHLGAVLRLTGGGLYKLETEEGCALAAAEYEGDGLTVKELLCPPAQVSAALALLAKTLPAARYTVRLPEGDGASVAFGRVKWYDGTRTAGGGYLAFALD